MGKIIKFQGEDISIITYGCGGIVVWNPTDDRTPENNMNLLKILDHVSYNDGVLSLSFGEVGQILLENIPVWQSWERFAKKERAQTTNYYAGRGNYIIEMMPEAEEKDLEEVARLAKEISSTGVRLHLMKD